MVAQIAIATANAVRTAATAGDRWGVAAVSPETAKRRHARPLQRSSASRAADGSDAVYGLCGDLRKYQEKGLATPRMYGCRSMLTSKQYN